MGSNNVDSFDVHGPKHITDVNEIDWGNEEHRRCIAACLVKGVYVLKNDRAMRRTVKLTPEWWESFGFRLENENELREQKWPLFDTIYGPIFEYAPTTRHRCAPRYAIAFRGTKPWSIRDMYLDFRIVINKLEKGTCCVVSYAEIGRLMTAMREDQASQGQDSCIWLAGQSLGAVVALVVGRHMMEQEKPPNLPTFLFNPPHVLFITSINLLNLDPVAKECVHSASNALRLGATKIFGSHREHMKLTFERLSPWVPNLYVHENDRICQGFLDYFEQREKFKEGSPRVNITFTEISHHDCFWHLLGKDKDRPQLLPSAMLWKTVQNRLDPHCLQQWWKPNGELGLGAGTRYSYPSCT